MRISDWSSDVCSSDLALRFGRAARARRTEGVPMNITLAMLAAPVALIATALPAQDQAGDIADTIINNPNPQAFQVFNAPEPARVVADQTVQGGHALRVKLPGADQKAWPNPQHGRGSVRERVGTY